MNTLNNLYEKSKQNELLNNKEVNKKCDRCDNKAKYEVKFKDGILFLCLSCYNYAVKHQ
jgi:hypothetical protein